MGVITSNSRKRPQECMNLNDTTTSSSPIPISSDSHRKKPKFSSSTFTQNPKFSSSPPPSPLPSSFSSTVSRISRYPAAKLPLVREVHAPCRPQKFLLLTKPRRDSSFEGRDWGEFRKDNNMGNVFGRKYAKYEKAKHEALASIRSLPKGKEKEVIELDTDSRRYEVLDDSSVEEVQIVEDRDRDVVEIIDLDPKAVDGGIQKKPTSLLDTELIDSNLKNLVSAEKKWENSVDVSSVQVYKKLLDAVERRKDTTDRLKFDIELYEKRRDAFELLRPKKEPVEVIEKVPHEPFIALTQDEVNEVENAFCANRRKILVTHESSNIEISAEKFQCLRQGAWLNDEVINLYLELLKEREKREPKKFLKCHFFNTFFYKKLISGRGGYDFKSVRRWTSQRKLGYGLAECDKIFVPIHKEIHWCLAVINKKDQKFQYLDSLKGMDNQVLKVLARYYMDEVKDKTGEDIDVSSWEKELVEDLPEQENGFDCGVFMIKYADFYSRGLGLCFNQEHMPYFRRRTAKEILRLKAD
ncbi:hypothetical protein RIF29_03985 [Crotalaria pallida]|uniref:Ubiquitin-like protease family profile domain-containing protein n=1 Tax=Crotalaria pallida TaxID=3830 RepID=A0AAN9J0J9_CROPI